MTLLQELQAIRRRINQDAELSFESKKDGVDRA